MCLHVNTPGVHVYEVVIYWQLQRKYIQQNYIQRGGGDGCEVGTQQLLDVRQ